MIVPARFVGRLVTVQWRDWWVVVEHFAFERGLGRGAWRLYHVPERFCTDFASVPGWVRWLVWLLTLGRVDLAPTNPRYSAAAAVHDRLYETREVSRRCADLILYEAMGAFQPTGMTPYGRAIRWLVWAGVRLGGRRSYATGAVRQEERRVMSVVAEAERHATTGHSPPPRSSTSRPEPDS